MKTPRLGSGADMARFIARKADKHAHRNTKRLKTRAAQKKEAFRHG